MRKLLGVLFLTVVLLAPLPVDAQQDGRPPHLTALGAPQLRTPAHGTLMQSMGPISLVFDLPAGATQYQVQATPYNGDGPGVNLIRNAESSYTLQPPTLGVGPYVRLPGLTYTWRLRATDKTTSASETDPSWGPWTDPWSFTTPPPSAESIHPKDPPLGVTVTSLTPTVTWSDDNPYIFYYEIQVSRDNLFDTNPATAVAPVFWNLMHGGESRPFNSWAVPASYPLEQGTRYYWRVRPRVQGNGTPVNWGQPFYFVTPARIGTPSPSPTPTATGTAVSTSTPVVTSTATATATGTTTPTFTPTPTPTFTSTATPTPVATPTFTPTPTPTPIPAPTGKIVFEAYKDSSNNYSEIYVMNADGSGRTRLTTTTLTDKTSGNFAPARSPDGAKIAFHSRRDGNEEIYVMNADGSGQTRLTNNITSGNAYPAWSPDGAKIAFSGDGNRRIYVMNADGSGLYRLTNDSSLSDAYPAWSPDGAKIAFRSRRDGNNYQIYVVNTDGSGQTTRLTNNPAWDDNKPAWSPDGTKIAFHSNRDGNYDIYVMNADGSGPTRLTNNPASDREPAWSPDGAKIAFSSMRDGNYDIYVMNADGSGQTRITLNLTADEYPSWSPR